MRSSAVATYNETYSAPGPFSGFRPFAGGGTPDVLFIEGSAQMLAAESAVGASTSSLAASMRSWAKLTSRKR